MGHMINFRGYHGALYWMKAYKNRVPNVLDSINVEK